MTGSGFRGGMVGALAAVLVLGACSGGRDVPTLNLQIITAAREAVAARRTPPPAPPKLTRAYLDTQKGSFLEATVERTGQLAFLEINLRRRDGLPGEITVWRTNDNVTLAMRNGVLIATRGLPGDMISSEVQVRDGVQGPAGSGARVQTYLAGANQAVPLRLACTVTDLGPEPVTIVELTHPTRHLRERCEGGGGTVTNDYWVDSRAGIVWQSRQWAGPNTGYLRLRRLTR